MTVQRRFKGRAGLRVIALVRIGNAEIDQHRRIMRIGRTGALEHRERLVLAPGSERLRGKLPALTGRDQSSAGGGCLRRGGHQGHREQSDRHGHRLLFPCEMQNDSQEGLMQQNRNNVIFLQFNGISL